MTKFEKIKAYNVDDLTKFLITSCETSVTEYDSDDEPYEIIQMTYCTPFNQYPVWFTYDDVFEDTKEILLKEEGEL